MIKVNGEFNKIQLVLWELYHSLLLIGKIYTTIPLNTKTQKLWVVYLCLKNKFVDIFQI